MVEEAHTWLCAQVCTLPFYDVKGCTLVRQHTGGGERWPCPPCVSAGSRLAGWPKRAHWYAALCLSLFETAQAVCVIAWLTVWQKTALPTFVCCALRRLIPLLPGEWWGGAALVLSLICCWEGHKNPTSRTLNAWWQLCC